jgi:exportin-5
MHSKIVEPLLVFCTHVIRMRDTRCCNIMLRVFRSIVPDFRTVDGAQVKMEEDSNSNVDTSPIPASTASVIREYISDNVLKACIQSINEPYYVELQKEIASFIAAILAHYSPLTPTPRNVLLSVPNLQESAVDQVLAKISTIPNSKLQRNQVLELFRELKGVSISEMGKLSSSMGNFSSRKSSGKRASRSQMAQEFMTAPAASQNANGGFSGGNNGDDGSSLEGVAGLFNQ